ncbi:MAG: hypothetical protein PHV23_00585 [Candidatus Gracilibacteria bacterium]|nr:hypothetical protein [Candidatus Gracilibacteria bacterium]
MIYEHKQKGKLMIIVLFATIILFSFIFFQSGFDPILGLFMIFILFIIFSFSSLTVSLYSENIIIRFTCKLLKKEFSLGDVDSVKSVKNKWYFGWGIRGWFWPKYMWIYNVSGFDAVELTMKNGKIYRIGTDEPKKLEGEILKLINKK